jgi:hypothetical protein
LTAELRLVKSGYVFHCHTDLAFKKSEETAMPKSIEYKGYVVSAYAEQWAEGVWAGSYIIRVQSTGKRVREFLDAVMGETFDGACDGALAQGQRYIDRTLSGNILDERLVEADVQRLENGKYRGFVIISLPDQGNHGEMEFLCDTERDTVEEALSDAEALAAEHQ